MSETITVEIQKLDAELLRILLRITASDPLASEKVSGASGRVLDTIEKALVEEEHTEDMSYYGSVDPARMTQKDALWVLRRVHDTLKYDPNRPRVVANLHSSYLSNALRIVLSKFDTPHEQMGG